MVLLALALVPVVLIGACLMLAAGAGILNYRDDARDRAAAESDSRFQRPLVSTDGRILFVAQNNATDDFYLVNADGTGLRRLTHLPQRTLHSSAPAVSKDGTRLAISVGGIMLVPLNGGGETVTLNRPGGSLAWSHDAKQLASLDVDKAKRLHLYTLSADGSGAAKDIAAGWPSTAAGDEQYVRDLVWSPDMKRFAFVLETRPAYKRTGPSHTHVYLALADGSGLRNLSREPGALVAGGGLTWSPDGRRLAFYGGRGIGTVDIDLEWRDFVVAPHRNAMFQYPAWSPDGERLAWFNPDSIVISDPDGGRQQELTRGRCRGVHPSWADDGLRIAFVCTDSRDQGNIFVSNADGSGLTQITHLGSAMSSFVPAAQYHPRYPLWLPSISPAPRVSQ